MSRIADKVNLERVTYARVVNFRRDKAVVTFAPSTNTLFFNPKMTELLRIGEWKQVVVGIDVRTKIIVIKCCDGEEYGSVVIGLPGKPGKPYCDNKSTMARRLKCRQIKVQHLVKTMSHMMPTVFHAERDGEVVFLESLSQESENGNTDLVEKIK